MTFLCSRVESENNTYYMRTFKQYILEVSPPGFEGTVKAMKKHKEIDNPWALAWHMKSKGYRSHRNKDGTKKNILERASFIDKVHKLSDKMNISNISAGDQNIQMHVHDRDVGKHELAMSAHHDRKRNISKVDFAVDDEGTARTGRAGHKSAKRIIHTVAAFIHKHHENMGGGDHKIQFDAYKGSHHHANPDARASIYRRLVKKAGESGFTSSEHDRGHKTTFTLSKSSEKKNV